MSIMFGKEGLIGYILGLNLIGLHITILSLLQSTSMRNARFYNECTKKLNYLKLLRECNK